MHTLPPSTRRARIHALEKQLASMAAVGLVETNAGVRSCMIEYELRQIALPALLDLITRADAAIGDVAVRRRGAGLRLLYADCCMDCMGQHADCCMHADCEGAAC